MPVLMLTAATACDDGKIYDDLAADAGSEVAATVMFSGDLTGLDTWTGDYTVVVAGFGDSDYAEVSKPVTGTGLEISGITGDITAIELCVINRLRKRVATFASTEPVKGSDGHIHFDVGKVNAGMYDAIQTAVFDAACVQCHGGSNHSAAQLNLTSLDSYAGLVNAASVKSPEKMRVSPGEPSASVLWLALATGLSERWAYHHHTIITNTTSVDLVKNWIGGGAKK